MPASAAETSRVTLPRSSPPGYKSLWDTAAYGLSVINPGMETMITDIEVRDAGAKGKGVFALRHFGSGEFIFRRRRGRIIANNEIATLSAEDQRRLDDIDEYTSEILTSPGRYFNHACEPNAMPHGMDLYAWKVIEAGEEITVDYRLRAMSDNRWDCACGSAVCPGHFDHCFFAPRRGHAMALSPLCSRVHSCGVSIAIANATANAIN